MYTIDYFTVVYSVTWPLNGSEAAGDLVLIQTSLLLLCKTGCSYAQAERSVSKQGHLASLPFKGQVTEQITVKWSVVD